MDFLLPHLNMIIIVAYMVGMVGLGLYLSRYVKQDEDYFLAGRTLNKWIIAGTIMATDIAAIYLVGPAGNAYEGGIPILLCSWTGNMIAALSALIFVPRLRRLRITTVTELMETRYNVWLRMLPTILWIVYYSLFAGNCMYTLSAILSPVLGVDDPNKITLIIGIVVILYCSFSGLLAVAYTDVIQAFLIIIGALILLPLSMKAVGGVSVFADKIPQNYFVFWKTGNVFPNYKDLIMFIMIGLPYWCTSQYMLQRSFAGRSVRDASRGLALAALMTGPITLAYILPGICGHLLYPEGLEKADTVLTHMFMDILPVGVAGLFIAALLAADNSTAAGLLNSMSTLTSNDIFRRFIPGKSSNYYMWVGRLATVAGGCVGLVFAYNVERLGGIIEANFNIMSFFEPPIFVAIAAAMFWKRANAWGAAAGIVAGVLFNIWGVWGHTPALSSADRTIWGFPICIGFLIVGSWIHNLVDPPTAAHKQKVEAFFARMRGSKINWNYRLGWVGISVAATALTVMIVTMVFSDLLPKPLNVILTMGMVSTFVASCYLTVPMFVNDEAEEAAPETLTATGQKTIEGSLLQRFIGSGWTWLAIYGGAIILVFVIYFLVPAGKR